MKEFTFEALYFSMKSYYTENTGDPQSYTENFSMYKERNFSV